MQQTARAGEYKQECVNKKQAWKNTKIDQDGDIILVMLNIRGLASRLAPMAQINADGDTFMRD